MEEIFQIDAVIKSYKKDESELKLKLKELEKQEIEFLRDRELFKQTARSELNISKNRSEERAKQRAFKYHLEGVAFYNTIPTVKETALEIIERWNATTPREESSDEDQSN